MPIRGLRPTLPSKGKSPTGIFSTGGSQKQDGASGPNMGTLSYAHGNSNDKNAASSASGVSAGRGDRHQAPKKGW